MEAELLAGHATAYRGVLLPTQACYCPPGRATAYPGMLLPTRACYCSNTSDA